MRTYTEILKALPTCDNWMYYSDYCARSQRLSVYIDDFKADRRRVYEVDFKRGQVTLHTIAGYNPAKHSWTNTISREGWTVPGNGKKKLIDFCREKMKEKFGYYKDAISFYPAQDKAY